MSEILAAILIVSVAIGYAPPADPEKEVVDLKKLSVADLVKSLETAERTSHVFGQRPKTSHFEAVLQEIIKRKGDEAEKAILEILDRNAEGLKTAERRLESLDFDKDREAWLVQSRIADCLRNNLEYLTVLRRLQKKPDPLAIDLTITKDVKAWREYHHHSDFVQADDNGCLPTRQQVEDRLKKAESEFEAAKTRLAKLNKEKELAAWEKQKTIVAELEESKERLQFEAETLQSLEELAPRAAETKISDPLKADTRNLPTIVVALRSADIDRVPVFITRGGDYRSGREARWRIEVKDAAGRILALRPFEGSIGGGLFSEEMLGFGKTWKTALPMASFIHTPQPGTYTVTVMYHNNVTIADIVDPDDSDELIVFKSPPFKLLVEKAPKIVIEASKSDREKATTLIGQLPDSGAIKIVDGDYDESEFRFLLPESPAGQLLKMKWKAVPALLDALNQQNRSRHRKAWVLCLLFTITSERDLEPTGFDGAVPDREFPNGSSSGHRILPKQQQNLIEKWNEWRRDYLDVREVATD